MTSLVELQARVQDSILKRTSAALALVAEPPHGSVAEAFGVYQDAYDMRHCEFLANDHEVLREYIGAVAFEAMAQAYSSVHPSRYPNARWYSNHLPSFLTGDKQFHKHPELAEIAALEFAFNTAFDAADAPIVRLAHLALLDPASFGLLSFVIHPSVLRLVNVHNTSSIWSALKCNEAPPGVYKLEAPQQILVWRQNYASRFRILGDEEAMAFDSAAQGVSFGVICEMIATVNDPDTAAIRAAGYLRGWLEAEVISEIRLAEQKVAG